MADCEPYRLPTAAADLLADLVGRRLVRVRRRLEAQQGDASTSRDSGEGPVELLFDDGFVIHVAGDPGRLSVVIGAGELPASAAGTIVEVSRNEFWRWRLRRPVSGVQAWKSLDVPARAPELEFGLEVGLGPLPGFAVELVLDEGIEALRVSDGTGAERHRVIPIAGVVGPTPPRRGGSPERGRSRRSSRRR